MSTYIKVHKIHKINVFSSNVNIRDLNLFLTYLICVTFSSVLSTNEIITIFAVGKSMLSIDYFEDVIKIIKFKINSIKVIFVNTFINLKFFPRFLNIM